MEEKNVEAQALETRQHQSNHMTSGELRSLFCGSRAVGEEYYSNV